MRLTSFWSHVMAYARREGVVALCAFILFAAAVLAWTDPTASPPAFNAPAPINVSSTVQTKVGGVNFATTSGNVGIATATPNALYRLDVNGIINATDFYKVGSPFAVVPAGAVMFFNLLACPSGWTELTTARGRYIVGLPLSGTLAGTAGTALTNLENRAVGLHNHTINDPSHSHSYLQPQTLQAYTTGGAGPVSTGTVQTGSSTTGITINNAGTVAGTNAPYIQLLVCQKS